MKGTNDPMISSAGAASHVRPTAPADTRTPSRPASSAGLVLAIIMLLLLFFPKLSLEGARSGLLLWYQTVLPTLLPFMVCTNLAVSMNATGLMIAPAAPILKRIFRLSDPGCFVLLSGILCGYPMGAKNCSDLLDQGCLSLSEARCLYAVSSFPSPMFLAGYMMAKASQTAGSRLVLPFWKMAAAVYLPALPMFFLAARLYGYHGAGQRERRMKTPKRPDIRAERSGRDMRDDRSGQTFQGPPARLSSRAVQGGPTSHDTAVSQTAPVLPLDEALSSSISVMVKIGGYLMLFSILARFIGLLTPPGSDLSCLLISVAEMTTGMEAVSQSVRGLPGVLLVLGAGTFGGLSGAFQVRSVTKNAGCSIRHYILWKITHCLLSCLILTFCAMV